MARKVVETVINDLTGNEIPEADVREVRFYARGEHFVLDTDEAGATEVKTAVDKAKAAYDKVMAKYADKATVYVEPVKTAAKSDGKTAAVRAWAKTQDEWADKVGDRGRLHADVVEAYDKAHATA